MYRTSILRTRFGIPEPVVVILATLAALVLAAMAVIAVPQNSSAAAPRTDGVYVDVNTLTIEGQCPVGTTKIESGWEGMAWQSTGDYGEVWLVAGPEDVRWFKFTDVTEGEWISRTVHDISHICVGDPQEPEPDPSGLIIHKASADESQDLFSFQVEELDGPVIANPSLAIGGSSSFIELEVGTWYEVSETNLPEGWTLSQIQCDGATVESISLGDAMVTMKVTTEETTAECTFTNDGPTYNPTPTKVQVLKDGTGPLDVPFDFTVEQIDTGTVGTPQLALNGYSESYNVAADKLVTMTEGDLPEGWTLEDATCVNATDDYSAYAVAFDAETQSLSFTPAEGDYIMCEFFNTYGEPGVARILKTLSGAPEDYPWSFDFEISDEGGVIDGGALSGIGLEVDGSPDIPLTPDVTYTITELNVADNVPQPNWICWDGEVESIGDLFSGVTETLEDLDDDPNSFTFVATEGMDLTCGVINYLQPQVLSSNLLNVTKEVVGVDEGYEWEFAVELTAEGGGGASAQTVSGTGPSESDSPATWTNLPVGTTYVLSEGSTFTNDGESGADVATYFTTTLVCDGVTDEDAADDTVTFTVTEETTSVTCELVNTLIPKKVLAATGAESTEWMLAGSAALMMLGTGAVIAAGRRERL